MTGITVREIAAAADRVRVVITERYQELNAADARLGDGDTGTMLLRLAEAVASVDANADDDVGMLFVQMARAAMRATGSSLGTLIGTALRAVGQQTKGRAEVDDGDWTALLQDALDAMMARGGASLGDKTILDSIKALIDAPVTAGERAGAAYVAACRAALDAFRLRPNKVGRARMFGDATIGIDDPGMLACCLMLEAILAPAPTRAEA